MTPAERFGITPLPETGFFVVRRAMEKWTSIYGELGELLQSGYALTSKDIAPILAKHGIGSPEDISSASDRMGNHLTKKQLEEQTGVKLGSTRYKRRIIYFDSSLDLETDTDYLAIRERIDRDNEEVKRGKNGQRF